MYILMIARGYPTEEDPQWGCFEQDQAEALCNNGHQVVVLSVDSRFLWKFRKVAIKPFSYTHMTQHTILNMNISVVAL